jgi:predicted RNA-binding Zn-ribbon protein involved in translation (DUF1610 family)
MSENELSRSVMKPQSTSKPSDPWESVHVCPRCGHVINLERLDLRTIATGVISCPKCDWSGPVNIKVVQE